MISALWSIHTDLTLEHVQDRSLRFDSQPMGGDSQSAASSAACRLPRQQNDLRCCIFASERRVNALLEFLFTSVVVFERSSGSLQFALVCVRLLQGPPVSHILTFLVQQEPHSGSNLAGFSPRLNYI